MRRFCAKCAWVFSSLCGYILRTALSLSLSLNLSGGNHAAEVGGHQAGLPGTDGHLQAGGYGTDNDLAKRVLCDLVHHAKVTPLEHLHTRMELPSVIERW